LNTVNMHEAKTHLSKLVAKAVQGEPFVIAKAGKPLVKVTAIDELEMKPERRIGFLEGKIKVPDDFKAIGREEIEEMFGFKFGEGE
jgi:prevent-host-death family protein